MSLTLHTCPSCSSVLTFRSRDTNLIVCHQCGNRLQRWDDGVLKGKPLMVMAQGTLTPIQIGTTGVWQDKKFTVIGRVRCVFDEDYVNNWSIYFEDGMLHTLVESYGQFAVYEKISPDVKLTFHTLKNLAMGSGTVEALWGGRYIRERRSKCERIEVEGETWVFDWDGHFESIEGASLEGDRIEILEAGNLEYLYFRIHYHEFEDFDFQQLRRLSAGAVTKTLTCTSCNKSNDLKSFPLSQSFCCKHCGAALSYRQGKVIHRNRLMPDKAPAVPLNTRGTLKGVEYEMVGYAEKEDAHGWGWREYTLFSPVRGYAFLSEFNGHWIFLRERNEAPVMQYSNNHQLHFGGEEFLLYNEYRYSIKGGRGEFPTDVFNDAEPHCREFISPPEIWSREMHKEGFIWYHGEHISNNDLYKAFGSEISLPYRIGVGAVQPVRGYVNLLWLKRSMIAMGAFIFILFCITAQFNKEQEVYSKAMLLQDSAAVQSAVTEKFRLEKGSSNLEVKVSAPLTNTWLETNITLINADNGKEYPVVVGLEYYSGYEGGESWSEGSASGDGLITSLPGGNYFMEISVAKERGTVIPEVMVKAYYDLPMWSNFFVFLVMVLLPGLITYFYLRIREGSRWSNSNFSPYSPQ